MIHKLKIEKPYLEAKLNGDKLFEIRFDDRGYQKGDIVEYMLYEGSKIKRYRFEITYVTAFRQQSGWVVFGERPVKDCIKPEDNTKIQEEFAVDYLKEGGVIDCGDHPTIRITEDGLDNLRKARSIKDSMLVDNLNSNSSGLKGPICDD